MMMTNADFAAIAGSEASERVRFDHKQIKAWDKQNEAAFKKRKSVKMTQKEPAWDKAKPASQKYRDRAQERRSEMKDGDNDSRFDEIVSKLNPEQTKYLGGDAEHTHLVKVHTHDSSESNCHDFFWQGLDYALLEKSRMDTGDVSASQPQSTEELKSSEFANRLRRIIFPSLRDSTIRTRPPLQGVSFDFCHSDPFTQDELPTLVSKANYQVWKNFFSVLFQYMHCRKVTKPLL